MSSQIKQAPPSNHSPLSILLSNNSSIKNTSEGRRGKSEHSRNLLTITELLLGEVCVQESRQWQFGK